MYKLQLNELTPGQKYYVKVRAKAPDLATSEWSPVFEFTTSQDEIAPDKVRDLEFTPEGDSFIARWKAPEVNVDGTPCTDLDHYELTFVNSDASRTVVLQSKTPDFTIDFNKNRQMFGTPSGIIEITVRAVDVVGNKSQPVSKIAQNLKPTKVKNVIAKAALEAIDVSWYKSEDTDIEKYRIYVSTTGPSFNIGPSSVMGEVAAGTTSFTHSTSSLSLLYVKITSVDKFEQESDASDAASAQPRLTTDFDKTPPAAVTGFSAVQVLSEDNSSATAQITYTASTEDDLDKYEVQYRKTGDSSLPWSFANIPSDETSAEIKPLPLATDYDFRIRAVDFLANKSQWASVVTAEGVKKTSLPDAPTNIVARGGMTNLMVTWTESTDPTMANWAGVYEVQASKAINFTSPIVVKTSSTLASLVSLEQNTVYYVRVRSIDPYGNVGPWSSVESENTGEVESSGNKSTFATTDPAGTGHSNGDIWHKVDPQDNIVGMWEFFDNSWIRREIKNLADDSVTSGTIAADAVLAGHIKAGQITGEKLEANAAVINNLQIQSAVEINSAGGHIKSSNYNADGSAGFYMDQQQLIINQGKIKAAALEIQNGVNIMPPEYARFKHREEFYESAIKIGAGTPSVKKLKTGGALGPVYDAPCLEFKYTTYSSIRLSTGVSKNINVERGAKYIVSFYANNKSGAPKTIHCALSTAPSGNTGQFTLPAQEGWIRYHYVFTVPENAAPSADISISTSTAGPATILFDGFQVEQKISSITTPSAWTPPGLTSVDGGGITTGSISSSINTSTANGDIPLWSINTEGNARFADAVINGKLIVGGRVGADNTNTYIQSDNYVTKNAGWSIKGDGDVEFNNGLFRGTLSLERVGSSEVPLRMTASVNDVKLYIDKTNFKNINVGSIRGVTYAYDRQIVAGQNDRYEPTNPNLNKIGRYFIGPTTDRSVNIQVHDGEDNAVYLDRQAQGVALTSLNIGEITSPTDQPATRERQGFSYTTSRYETDPDDPSRENAVVAGQQSSVRLSSPFFPEQNGGAQYPEASHKFESSVAYKASATKNLISREQALPGYVVGAGAWSGRKQQYFNAYELKSSASRAANILVTDITQNLKVGKKYVFSAHFDTVDAVGDIGVFAFRGNTPLDPLGSDVLTAQDADKGHTDYVEMFNPEYYYRFSNIEHDQATIPNGVSGPDLARNRGSYYVGHNCVQTSSTRFTTTSSYNLSSGMTVSMWIYPISGGPAGAKVLFHRASTGLANEIWLSVDSNNGQLSGGFKGPTLTTWSTGTGAVPLNDWSHVTLTVPAKTSGAAQGGIFVNGVLNKSLPMNNFNPTFSNEPYYFANNQQENQAFNGWIADIIVAHKVALYPQYIYSRGNPANNEGGKTVNVLKGIGVGAGRDKKRVAYEFVADSTTMQPITLQTVGNLAQGVYAYKLQLEELSYQDDVSLSPEIRSMVSPTPWSLNDVESNSQVRLNLNANPASDYDTWSIGSLPGKSTASSGEAVERESYAQMELELSSQLIDPGYTGNDTVGSYVKYKWSTLGMSYPGMSVPYMPTAAYIRWDYSSISDPSKPQLTNSHRDLTINATNASTGGINTGEGRKLVDSFDRADTNSSNGIGGPWQKVGAPRGRIQSNRVVYAGTYDDALKMDYYYHGGSLTGPDQEVSMLVEGYNYNFLYWYPGAALILSADPATKSFLSVRMFRDKIYVKSYINGIIRYDGTFNATMDVTRQTILFKVARVGNSVTVHYDSTLQISITVPNLPGGKRAGFSHHVGALDNFKATDAAPGAGAYGALQPGAINVNTGRGLEIQPNGTITVTNPGFYNVYASMTIGVGGNSLRMYWMTLRDMRPGYDKVFRLTGVYSSSGQMGQMTGSATLYLTGDVELRVHHDVNAISRVVDVDLIIARAI